MGVVKTRWIRVYRKRFHVKYALLRSSVDKQHIKDCTILIANHPDPQNIGGCEHCPSGDSVKIEFNTGWIIIYQMMGSEIHFLKFYKHVPGRV